MHTDALFFDEVAKQSPRWLSLHQTATASALFTGARFPVDLHLLIERLANEQFGTAKEVHLTTRTGADLRFRDFTLAGPHTRLGAGMWRPFPYGGVNLYLNNTNGSFVVEESTVTGTPSKTTTVHLENHIVTGIEGGAAADELHRYGSGGYYLRHALLGLNPKVRSAGGTQFEREKHAGNFYLGLDGLDDEGQPSRSGPGQAHNDCQFDEVTLTLDGELFVDHGRLILLDDPQVRELAEAWGPTDVLLDPNPRMIIPTRYTLRRN